MPGKKMTKTWDGSRDFVKEQLREDRGVPYLGGEVRQEQLRQGLRKGPGSVHLGAGWCVRDLDAQRRGGSLAGRLASGEVARERLGEGQTQELTANEIRLAEQQCERRPALESRKCGTRSAGIEGRLRLNPR
uniref:Uncharacterized protein n=1 Tax=Molossus molossus TaxID=27622 RepID=A0A7J8DC34_MOLMO|nr:hypothetical protein HJG59_009345 [Molossus molossus]